jgi:F-type H+-transporting ATPase subunit delta
LSANAIARRYAKALVQLGAEEGAVDKFHGELTGVEAVFAAHPELGAILSNPAYGIEVKRAILGDLTGKLGVSATLQNFILLLLERSRLSCLSPIIACYSTLADELSGVVRPVVSSALALSDGQIAEIKAALEKSTGKRVQLKVDVDPTLIGGVLTKIGDKVFDGSVKTQLAQIKDILQKG